MDSDFYSSVIPEPTTLLGVRLRPLSVGHLIILHRLRSAFVTPGEPVTFHDLALSVLICSLSYREGLRVFNSRDTKKLFSRWFNLLSGVGILTKLRLRKPRPIDFQTKINEFYDYLTRHSTGPYYTFEPSNSKPMHCPEVQVVRAYLMQNINLSDEAIMDRPWAVCLWDYVTLRALAGQLQMTNKGDVHGALELANRLAAKERQVV